MTEIVIIAAIAENNVIGLAGKLPWHIPEDMKHFRSLTLGHPVIMGRKTFESLGKPLDKRINIVITSQKNYQTEMPRQGVEKAGAVVVHSFEDAIKTCENHDIAFVIGGRAVFEEALPLADRMEITEVHRKVDGDVFFPDIDWSIWEETGREDGEGFSFVSYVRREKEMPKVKRILLEQIY